MEGGGRRRGVEEEERGKVRLNLQRPVNIVTYSRNQGERGLGIVKYELGNRLTTRSGRKTRVVRSADKALLSIPGKKSIIPQQTMMKSIRFQLSFQ